MRRLIAGIFILEADPILSGSHGATMLRHVSKQTSGSFRGHSGYLNDDCIGYRHHRTLREKNHDA